MNLNISYLLDRKFFDNYIIVLTIGDDNMLFGEKSIMKYDINNIKEYEVRDFEGKAISVNYLIIHDFYLFLIEELESLKMKLIKRHRVEDIDYLLSRVDSFLQDFDFDLFYLNNFEELMMQLNESSFAKLNEIINILKEEYDNFKRMNPEIDIYSDMIDWIEDALYLLKGFAKKLIANQEETINKLE
ncbi:conserved protein of unknown function [Tepidanaerobacter acetatoxydans Re1]|uniref:Uncharacterized protein n=1 Tax=Tepidanaerobacter acetatoxydans (strain DSM 21804 / JCM 16047 / Re1) TaxID=1209989 RepID=F4LXB2_TEPAE|nr:hypothetical protein [Tepidanaerobacter acetatoxydans]AEE91911.1 hypothetical protein TepRe1_1780 [Tepidanaerobacter acetatoxydans Re1]CCP26736.1 conserved protein of unknown function [Tepidanaerobacter acetatoxydans Re1]